MKQYKYHLDKTSKKFLCPSCHKKRFVRYIETATAQYADDQYGRCDRENECGYLKYPKGETIITTSLPRPKPIVTSYIDTDMVNRSLSHYDRNPLVQYLYSKYEKKAVEAVIGQYRLGTSNHFGGSAMFWQIDSEGRTRSGKIMGYDASTGKRSKGAQGAPQINWVHKALKLNEFNLKQCLFGLHLLTKDTKRVVVVESEKTALIMRLRIPDVLWLATGSLGQFKEDFLSPLKDYKFTAFPDKSGYDKWNKTAEQLNKKGYSIHVSDYTEHPDYEGGWDLVDVANFKGKGYSTAEKTANKLNQINPAFKTLVKAFDLVDQTGNAIRLE